MTEQQQTTLLSGRHATPPSLLPHFAAWRGASNSKAYVLNFGAYRHRGFRLAQLVTALVSGSKKSLVPNTSDEVTTPGRLHPGWISSSDFVLRFPYHVHLYWYCALRVCVCSLQADGVRIWSKERTVATS